MEMLLSSHVDYLIVMLHAWSTDVIVIKFCKDYRTEVTPTHLPHFQWQSGMAKLLRPSG